MPLFSEAGDQETSSVWELSWRPAQVNSRHFFKARLYSAIRNQAGPVQPGRIHGGPVRGRSLYKGDQCSNVAGELS